MLTSILFPASHKLKWYIKFRPTDFLKGKSRGPKFFFLIATCTYLQKPHPKTLASNYNVQCKIIINWMFAFDFHGCPKYIQTLIPKLWNLTKIKPLYKANTAKNCKAYRHKNIDKIKKRHKDRKQFTREYLKYCDTKIYKEQKR